jgi:hypothetical protein
VVERPVGAACWVYRLLPLDLYRWVRVDPPLTPPAASAEGCQRILPLLRLLLLLLLVQLALHHPLLLLLAVVLLLHVLLLLQEGCVHSVLP